jgi:alkanesulfonate monooxygenase SsuD/methylene tetrahydromethanopterin reductase-like flavin-dependent oxidoreductase (luciferase family)
MPRLGIALPVVEPDGSPLTARSLVDGARRIEAAGFAGAWMLDTIGRGVLFPDPLIALSVAATVTERIELGTCILQVPLRRPVELAHRALTTHLVCGGRFVFGVGSGSTPADFAAVGVDFAGRFRALREALPLMRALWRGERVGDAELHTWPATAGGPPVLIGSWGGRWVERAAAEYDGWIASGTRTWGAVAEAAARFRAAGGRRALISTVPVDLSQPGDEAGDDDRITLRCPPDEAARRLARLGGLGFTDVVVICREQTPEKLVALAALVGSPQAATSVQTL